MPQKQEKKSEQSAFQGLFIRSRCSTHVGTVNIGTLNKTILGPTYAFVTDKQRPKWITF